MLTNSLVSSVWLQMASSSSLASITLPVNKADSAKIHDMYLGNGLSIGLQIFQDRQPMALPDFTQVTLRYSWPSVSTLT